MKLEGKGVLLFMLVFIFIFFPSCGKSNIANSPQSETTDFEPTDFDDRTNKIEVSNVIDMNAVEALESLGQSGLTNISIKSSGDIEVNPELWVVSEQSIVPGTWVSKDSLIVLDCKRKCKLYLIVKSEANILFNTYDMDLYFDDVQLGCVANGKEFAILLDAMEGDHYLQVEKASDSKVGARWKIDVSKDMTLTFVISHGDSIDVKNAQIEDGVNKSAIEVIDVTGLVLADARALLQDIGITKVSEAQSIWNSNNWLVTAQSIEAGTIIDNQTHIILDCISLDDYFNTEYSGKRLTDIEALAKEKGFEVRFVDSADKASLEAVLAILTEEEKQSIFAESASQSTAAYKTASVSVILPDNVKIIKYKIKQENRRGSHQADTNITVDNNEEFAALINSDYLNPEAQIAFTEKLAYEDIIEFDCLVFYIEKHPKYNTRFLYILAPELSDGSIGTVLFMLENVGYYDFHFPPSSGPDSVYKGLRLRMAARVTSGEDPMFIYIQPVWTTVRE